MFNTRTPTTNQPPEAWRQRYPWLDFSAYPLRRKLLVAFLAVSLVSLLLVAVGMNNLINRTLNNEAGATLQRVAVDQAQVIGNDLSTQIALLQTLALNPGLATQMERVNVRYLPGSTRQSVARSMAARNAEWVNAADWDPVVQAVLSNETATWLGWFQEQHPGHIEIMVTDKFGALLAATDRPSDFYQGDESWWVNAYAQEAGAVFVSHPTLDVSQDQQSLIIAVPVYGSEGGSVVGILRSTYNLDALTARMEATRPDLDLGFDLYTPNGRLVMGSSESILYGRFTTQLLDRGLLRDLEETEAGFIRAEYQGQPQLISLAAVQTENAAFDIAGLDWQVLAYGRQSDVLPAFLQQARQVVPVTILGAVVVAMMAAAIVARRLVQPLSALTQVAYEISHGNLGLQAPVTTRDEIGALAQAFNAMADEIQQMVTELEDRVVARTTQLENIVNLNRRLSAVLELSELMRVVVQETQSYFSYDHVHIFLFDEARNNLVTAEASGPVGALLKGQGFQIGLTDPDSIVAQVARSTQPVLVADTTHRQRWLPHPQLPHTRSELAVPILVQGHIEGVLDVHSNQIGGLSGQDITVLQALADQLAIALRNANLFQRTEAALTEARRLQRYYTYQAWDTFNIQQEKRDYEIRSPEVPALAQVETPEADLAVREARTITLDRPAVVTDAATAPPQTLATPLKLGDQVIGVLGLHADADETQWSDNDIALIEAISAQMSLAIENARLFDETGRRAIRERQIAEATQRIWASGELEQVLQEAVLQVGHNLDAGRVIIRLGTEADLNPRTNGTTHDPETNGNPAPA